MSEISLLFLASLVESSIDTVQDPDKKNALSNTAGVDEMLFGNVRVRDSSID